MSGEENECAFSTSEIPFIKIIIDVANYPLFLFK